MRRSFEERTGAFGPEDAWFDARSRAFWDDALTRQGFARDVLSELAAPSLAWASVFDRAHRGLFYASTVTGRCLIRDLWSGAEFFVDELDDATRTALAATSSGGPFDARVVGLRDPIRVGILPGAIFHPEAAIEPIDLILEAARERRMETHEVLDALLRMELSLRSLSRVKPAYAYRVQALSGPGAAASTSG
jgi:hypothetical protein